MERTLANRPRQTQNTINANKRRVLKEFMNNLRPTPFKTVKGYNKIFNTQTATTYRIMDDLINTVVYTPQSNETAIEDIKNIYRANKGQTRHFLYIINENTVLDHTVNIPDLATEQFDQWLFYELFKAKFMITSEYSVFDKYDYSGKLYMFSPTSMVNKERIIQSFLDGLSHCVFTPILQWATRLRDIQDPEKSTIKKYNAIIKKIEKLAIEYKNGIPETKCDDVCEKLNIKIIINYLFTNETIIYGSKLIKPINSFTFTNTRINHLEFGNLICDLKSDKITTDELMQKIDEYDANKTFYYYEKAHGQINRLSTLSESWATTTEYDDAKRELETEYDMTNMRVDDITQKDLSEFIQRGTHYNCNIEFPKYEIRHNSDIKCIDQEKAYYNFKKCKYYDGFLGKITDFRECNKVMGVGLYLITDLQCNDKTNKLYKYNQVMNVYKSNNVYPSPALQFLTDNNFTYKIVAGCYGINKMEFEFGEDMLKKLGKTPYVDEDGNFKLKGSSFYALCTGSWDSRSTHKYKYMRGTEDDAQILKNNSVNNVWYSNGEIRIGIPRKESKHLGHITAFILEYQRISLFTQLFEMNINKVANIYVDGIYYTDHSFKILETFSEKDTDTYTSMIFQKETFISNLHTDIPILNIGKIRQNYTKELFLGAGGNGKTHYNLTDIGLIKPAFCAPTHKLNAVKHEETDIQVYTWACLLSENPILYKTIQRNTNVLIIDEVSMMSNEEKNKIMSKYSNLKIIMCGDVGYQLPCFSTGMEKKTPFTKDGFDNIQTLTKNYRVKCNKLLLLLNNIREYIDAIPIADGTGVRKGSNSDLRSGGVRKGALPPTALPPTDNPNISLCLDEINKITIDKLKIEYTPNDIIICRTNKVKNSYTEMFKDKKKWYITQSNKYTNAGEIYIVDKEPENSELRHGYTAHCIQGETCKNNIYIDYADIKHDIHGLYTAISRAEYLYQIKFI